MTKNRHPLDIFRSVAPELVHHKQNEDGRLGKDIAKEGATGSDIENEANSEAGKVMRYFGKENPFYFDMNYVFEDKAIILGGTPGSGKDHILKEAILPYDFQEINADEFHKYDFDGNIVINGTASDFNKISYIKEELESIGYETMMVFVTTTNAASKQRNEERGVRGGRVISEMVRFNKWQDGQYNIEKYFQLFENCISVDNSIDLRNASHEDITKHTLSKKNLAESIYRFMIGETDYQFEKMIVEEGGAGDWGTSKLTDRYKADTPGQTPGGFAPMQILSFRERLRDLPVTQDKKTEEVPETKISIGADRIGDEAGMPKSPGFGDNQTLDITGTPGISPKPSSVSSVMRWSLREETKKRFVAKYGPLAEQKLKETVNKLLRTESLDDPFSGALGMVSATTGNDQVRPTGGNQIDAEKQSIAGFKAFKKGRKLNTKKN